MSNQTTGQTMSNYSAKGLNSSSAIASKFTPSSKGKPCPVCGRTQDGDCRTQEQGNVVLCHTHQSGKEGDQNNGYTFLRSSDKGAGWGVWVWAGDKPIKADRPKAEPRTTYYYNDRSGNRLIRVQRQKGKSPEFWQEYFVEDKWVPAGQVSDAVKGQMRKSVPVYRYAEVQEAIANGLTVIWCEGEVCADALWNIGVPATTSIGGSNSYSSWGNYSKDLKGATLAIAPDRDEQGMKYAEEVAKDQKCDNWLFAFPKSPLWKLALPKNGGLDIADWISEGATKDDVLGAIRKPSVEATEKQNSTHSKPTDEQVSATVASVDLLLEKELKDWQELEELTSIQASSGLSKDAFWSMVASQRLERNITAHISVKTGSRPTIDWSKAPSGLAGFIAQINKDASKRSIDPTAVLWAVLPAVMSVLPKNSVLNMKGLEIPAILWSALLMESGHGKSRAEVLVMEPLRAMQSQELKEFKLREDQFEEDSKDSNKEEPEKPAPQRKYLFNVATIASLLDALSHQTLAGSLWLRDEIAGIFKSLGQFSKGDNEEKEVFLAFWDGVSALVDRKSSGSSETADPRLSLFGGLQPGKFRQVFKDADDVDGLAARVMLAFPGVVIDRHREGEVKLPYLMRGIFDHLQNSNMQVKPVRAAYELWNEAQYQARLSAEKQSSGAIAAWMRKMPGHLGRMALALHALECGCNADKQTQELSLETMKFAMELCRYSLESYRFMLEQGTDSQDVESVVSKILNKANQIGGLTAREAVQYIKPLTGLAKENKKTPSSMALDLFSVLVEQGKGVFRQVGKTKKFIPVLHLQPEEKTNDSEKSSTVATHPEALDSKGKECVEPISTVASTHDDLEIKVGDTVEIIEGNLRGHKAIVTGTTEINGKATYILKGIHADFNRERAADQIRLIHSSGKS